MEPSGHGARGPSLWSALRSSVSALTDDFARFLVANVVWLAVTALVLVLGRLHVAAHLLLIVLVPITAGLGRMAAYTAREQVARLGHFREGMVARWPASMFLGALQLLVAAVSWLNLQVGLTAATLPLVAAAIASAWLLLLVAASAVTVWPLLLDPDRDEAPVGRLLRVALAVAMARPGRIAILVAIVVVLVMVGAQFLVAAVLLPSLGVLAATHATVPIADRLEGRTPSDTRHG
jgi:hypothetical protein